MQLDFFRQLTELLRPKPKRKPATPVAPRRAGSDPALETQARRLLAALGCDALAAKVRVVWNPRMRSTAGMGPCRARTARSIRRRSPRSKVSSRR